MKKLKVKFKALDSKVELVAKIRSFMKELGYEVERSNEIVRCSKKIEHNGEIIDALISLNIDKKLALKRKKHSARSLNFTNEELKFFDSLGFDLSEWHKQSSNQQIEDWYLKGLDELSKRELVKLILTKLKSFGYKFNWIGLDKDTDYIIESEEAMNDLPEDFDDFWALSVVSVDSVANSTAAEEIRFNFENMTVMKKLSDHTAIINFTNKELKFFDSLGFKISSFHKKITEQEVEDWYLKGLDQLTKIELIRLILAELKSLGYRFNWLGLKKEKRTTVIRSEELNKTLDALPKDFNGFVELTVVSGTDPEKSEMITINLESMTVTKTPLNYIKAINFTNEELKFFDSLGFKLSPWQRRKSNQEIEDWYLKGLDQLTKIELVKLIIAKVKNLGYSFDWLSLKKEKRIIIRSEEELNKTLDALPKDFDNFLQLVFVSGTDWETSEMIAIHFEGMIVEKMRISYATNTDFTNEELKLFDSLGFDVSKWHKTITNQQIEDWYLDNKANDELTQFELVKLIIAKTKAFGYRLDWLGLKKERYSVIQSEEELDEAMKDLPEDFNGFEDLVLVSGTNPANAIKILINFKDMTIEKSLTDYSNARNFTNDELKFFDGLGFDLSLWHKKNSSQEIEDWYLKGLDQLTKIELLKLVLAKMKSLGYMFSSLSLDGKRHPLQSEEELNKTLNELPDDFNGFWTLILNSNANSAKAASILISFKNMRVEKALLDYSSFVKFTNEELKFFDSLGFDLSPWQKKKSKQTVEDWYLKGLDELTKPELIKLVTRKLAELDYIIDDERSIFDWSDEELKNIISIEYDHKLTRNKIKVSFNDKHIVKIAESHEIIKFTNEELKFFDSLGFKLSKRAVEETQQDIEDWFIKGLDGLDPLEAGLELLGYKELKHESLTDTIRRFINDSGVIIYINNKIASKFDGAGTQRFTNAELKLLDTLGYSLSGIFDIKFDQHIEDWFKANDQSPDHHRRRMEQEIEGWFK